MATAQVGADGPDLPLGHGEAGDGTAGPVDPGLRIGPVQPFGPAPHHRRENRVRRGVADGVDHRAVGGIVPVEGRVEFAYHHPALGLDEVAHHSTVYSTDLRLADREQPNTTSAPSSASIRRA